MSSHIEEKQSENQEEKAQPNRQEMQIVWMEYKKNGTSEVRNQLIEYFFPLVERIARTINAKIPGILDVGDLKSVGVFGLSDAIEAFDLPRGTQFSYYCQHRIRGAMLDELRKMNWVPRRARESYKLVKEVRMKLFPLLGHEPTDEEIRGELDMDIAKYTALKHEAKIPEVQSLHQETFDTEQRMQFTGENGLEDRRAESPDAREERADNVRKLLRGFNRQERLLIILYYREKLEMKEIGEHLELSTSGVSLMHKGLKERLLNRLIDIRTQEESSSAPRPINDKFFDAVAAQIIAALLEPKGGYDVTKSMSA